MGCTNIWNPIQETQFEAKIAMLVNLVDINVLMLLWANLSRHLDRCMPRMLRRDTSCHLLVSRVQPHAVLDTIKHPPVKHPVMLLMQATMFLAQPNEPDCLCCRTFSNDGIELMHRRSSSILCQLLVKRCDCMLDITKHPPVKHPVMLLMQAMFRHSQTSQTAVRQERTNPAQDNPRVTMLMQATMFLARPKRARLLVLLEPLAPRQDDPRVLTLQRDIMCHILLCLFRLHAVQVTIRHLPDKLPVMLLMQATMFLARPASRTACAAGTAAARQDQLVY